MRTFISRLFILPLSMAATLITALTTVTATTSAQADSPQVIDGGQGYLCVLIKTDGGVKCWGSSYGLGAAPAAASTPEPKDTINLSGVVILAAGSSHNCALRNDEAVLCWGDNWYGSVGEASIATRYLTTPQIVHGTGGAIGISSGASGQHSCTLIANFSAKCWGYGTSGQLGNNLTRSSNVRQQVLGGDTFATIAAGACHSRTVTLGGAVKCWGYNGNGQLVDGRKSDRRTPTSVLGLSSGVIDVATGFAHNCALLAMAEYRHAALDYYFITSRYQEKLLLKAVAPDLQATERSVAVNPTAFQAGSKSITRFYFDAVAKGGSRGSHFYTLVDSERDALNGLNPSNVSSPRVPYNEGMDSFAVAPAVEGVEGSCAAGQTPVSRTFRGNARFPDDPNDRFISDPALHTSLVAVGWDGEGVKMCAPK